MLADTVASSRLAEKFWKLSESEAYSRARASSCSATRGVRAIRSWIASICACRRSISAASVLARSSARYVSARAS